MLIAKGFKEEELAAEQIRHLRNLSRAARADVLKMARLAGRPRIGGSLSSVDIFVTVLGAGNFRAGQPDDPKRDRLVLGHAHTAPALYAALGRFDFFDLDDAIALFQKAGSVFEAAPDRTVPGVEWTAGGLGMSLSAACGFALGTRIRGIKGNVFVVMSDGEQNKGQVAEARRFAKRARLNNITAIVDFNTPQSGVRAVELSAQNLKHEYIADGWDVIEIPGHDHGELYKALRRAIQIQSAPVLVLAHTTMGSGVSFLEQNLEYQERPLTEVEYDEAIRELRGDGDLAEAEDYRNAFGEFDLDIEEEREETPVPQTGTPATYPASKPMDPRAAAGEALADVGRRNRGDGATAIAVVDAGANPALTAGFARENRENYVPFGVQDHAAATAAGALSLEGVVTVFAGSAMFGLDATYHQLRVDDINRTHLKVVLTDLGLDAGPDGKGNQCTDFVGLADNLYGFRSVFPADANQADRALRYVLGQPGNWLVGIGGGQGQVVSDEKGKPFFAGSYEFRYGGVDLVRPGDHGVIVTTGPMLTLALQAWKVLKAEGMAPSILHVACPKTLDDCSDPVLLQCLRKGRVISYEEHNLQTGLGSRLANCIALRGVSCRLLKVGADRYGSSGTSEEVRRRLGLDVDTLVQKALKFLKR